MIRLLMAIGLALMTAQAFAQVQVPKSYSDGEVIYADELNTNLKAIADAVPPRNCTTDQIIKWDGSAWVCADMPSGGGGGGAGTRVWRDAGGNLFPEEDGRYVFYRFPESDYVFQIWNYTDERYSNIYLWFNTPDCSGQPVAKLEDQSGSWKRGFRTSTHWLLPDFNASEIAFSGTANNWSLMDSSGECETLTNDLSFAALPMIESSAPLNLITPPIELIWAD